MSRIDQLQEELRQVDDGTHPRLLSKLEDIRRIHEEQKEREEIAYEIDEAEKKIEHEYNNMDISRIGSLNSIDSSKKTLRGRGGILIEPPTYFNATPKPPTPNITPNTTYLLTDSEIAADVRAVSGEQTSSHKVQRLFEVNMTKQKLAIDGKMFKQGEEVYVENLEYGKFPAKMDSISEAVVSFKSTLPWDTRQIHASYSDLTEGRVQIMKKRSN
uniref:SEP domain-containing protein n=1 Tax=Heterorhabditis bacteriophora TaxID=37862 RepID=A0A1I7XR12_HETBA